MDHLQSGLKISLAQYSDKGVKPENQDTLGAKIAEGTALITKGIALAIADGVSSSSSAQQASQSAVRGFLTDYYATPDTWRTQQSATQVIQSLNQYLWGRSRNNVKEEALLTTFSSLILKGDTAFIFHVGDTRVYRYRTPYLEQLTRDHSQRIDKKTTYLSRALGADLSLEIDKYQEQINLGDIFILTSDGVHDAVSRSEFQRIVSELNDVQAICDALVKQAKLNKTQDNISVQVVRIDEVGLSSQDDAITVLSKLPFPPLLDVGQKLDGMEVKQILHESERSQVYLVQYQANRLAVMKTPSVNYSDDAAYIERFVMEAWIGTRIQNSHVVNVLPAKERNFLYYLTEHIPGPTLGELIKQRAPFDIPDAIELMEQIVKGVRAFHRKDTLHQDIKPDNIVIGARGATIIDFGSCWVAGVEEAGAPFQRDRVLGTLRYSAPEYRAASSVSQRSDQFSLGVLLYEMLTGKLPYGEAYEKQMNHKGFQRLQYIPARQHNPLVPVWLDRAIEKSVSIHASGRYQAMSEWLRDLKRPNPSWTNKEDIPLIERYPTRIWQLIAAVGWLLCVYLLVRNNN